MCRSDCLLKAVVLEHAEDLPAAQGDMTDLESLKSRTHLSRARGGGPLWNMVLCHLQRDVCIQCG